MAYNRGDALKIRLGYGTQIVIFMCEGKRTGCFYVRRWKDSKGVLGSNESMIGQSEVIGPAEETDPRTEKARKAWLDMLAKGV